jgi:site-specific DNA recombinase
LIKAVIYTRVSAEDQAEEAAGLEIQREECLALAKVKGWTVVAEYNDDGSGAKSDVTRPGLAKFLKAACGGEIGAVIIPSLDRLGKSTRLVLRLVNSLNECGVIIISCKEALDTATSTGGYVLRMFASLAELERDALVGRATKGRDARGRIDGERGGQMPMGYKRVFDEKGVSCGVEINETEAETVRYVFALRARGSSLQAIADRLNYLGVKTSRGKQWHASSVKVLLNNEGKYRGGRRWESSYRWPTILV